MHRWLKRYVRYEFSIFRIFNTINEILQSFTPDKMTSSFHFIEVKYRRTRDYGLPQESVIQKKQHKIQRTAQLWLQRRHLPVDTEMHIDVLAIHKDIRGRIHYEYIEDAF